MKQYAIKKLVYANNIKELEDMFPGGETIYIECIDEIKNNEQFGFNKKYGNIKE